MPKISQIHPLPPRVFLLLQSPFAVSAVAAASAPPALAPPAIFPSSPPFPAPSPLTLREEQLVAGRRSASAPRAVPSLGGAAGSHTAAVRCVVANRSSWLHRCKHSSLPLAPVLCLSPQLQGWRRRRHVEVDHEHEQESRRDELGYCGSGAHGCQLDPGGDNYLWAYQILPALFVRRDTEAHALDAKCFTTWGSRLMGYSVSLTWVHPQSHTSVCSFSHCQAAAGQGHN